MCDRAIDIGRWRSGLSGNQKCSMRFTGKDGPSLEDSQNKRLDTEGSSEHSEEKWTMWWIPTGVELLSMLVEMLPAGVSML
jgi:hypothetical protein